MYVSLYMISHHIFGNNKKMVQVILEIWFRQYFLFFVIFLFLRQGSVLKLRQYSTPNLGLQGHTTIPQIHSHPQPL